MLTWLRYFLWGVGLRLRLFFKLDDGGDKDNCVVFVVLGEDVEGDDDDVATVEGVDDALNVLIDFRVDGGDLDLKKKFFIIIVCE